MTKRPLILVTNDDGITAPGLRTLIKVMNNIGEVIVVAPDSPQSAMGHAITINDTLYCKKEQIDDGPQSEYSTSGTPADCVKLAIHELLDRKPDLCVSGVNHGSNSSINIVYSGTMSAAIEAGMEGIPSIGFSLLNYHWEADFSQIESFIKTITNQVLNQGLQKGVILKSQNNQLKSADIGHEFCVLTTNKHSHLILVPEFEFEHEIFKFLKIFSVLLPEDHTQNRGDDHANDRGAEDRPGGDLNLI